MVKRILSMLLVVVMLLSLCGVTVFAAEGEAEAYDDAGSGEIVETDPGDTTGAADVQENESYEDHESHDDASVSEGEGGDVSQDVEENDQEVEEQQPSDQTETMPPANEVPSGEDNSMSNGPEMFEESADPSSVTLQSLIDAADSGAVITLAKDYDESISIPEGKTITIDLAGFSVNGVAADTITVGAGAVLTVKDSAEKDGAVKAAEGFSAIQNNGTVNIEAGEFDGALKPDESAKAPEGVENDSAPVFTYAISGGAFKAQVDEARLGASAQAKVGETYFVGNDIQKAAEEAVTGDTIEVLNGDVTLTGVADGVAVNNSGNGNVVANEQNIGPGTGIVIAPVPISEATGKVDLFLQMTIAYQTPAEMPNTLLSMLAGIMAVPGGKATYSYVIEATRQSASETGVTAKNVVVKDVIPEGFTVSSYSQGGSYDEASRTVTWNVGEMNTGIGGRKTVSVTLDIPTNPTTSGFSNFATATVENGVQESYRSQPKGQEAEMQETVFYTFYTVFDPNGGEPVVNTDYGDKVDMALNRINDMDEDRQATEAPDFEVDFAGEWYSNAAGNPTPSEDLGDDVIFAGWSRAKHEGVQETQPDDMVAYLNEAGDGCVGKLTKKANDTFYAVWAKDADSNGQPDWPEETEVHKDSVTIAPDGTVKLVSDHMAKEEVKTIAVAFNITPTYPIDQVTFGFEFDAGINAMVKSAKQNDANKNLFTIRIAGVNPLLTGKNTELTLGKLTVKETKTGEAVKAEVNVPIEDGLKYVAGSEEKTAAIDEVTATLDGKEGNPDASSLQTLIDNTEAGKTLTLLQDYNEAVTVSKNITIDLGTFTVTNSTDVEAVAVAAANAPVISVTNGAKLTLTGSGTVKTVKDGAPALDVAADSEAVINSGVSITMDKGIDTAESGTVYAVVNASGAVTVAGANITAFDGRNAITAGKTLNVNGGVVSSDGGSAIFAGWNASKVSITDGTIYCNNSQKDAVQVQCDFDMSGGTISHPNGWALFVTSGSVSTGRNLTANISGSAVINGKADFTGPTNTGNTSRVKLNVTGGTFNERLYTTRAVDAALSNGSFKGGITVEAYTGANASHMTISGGRFNSLLDIKEGADVSITGGAFDNNPNAYLEDGYAEISVYANDAPKAVVYYVGDDDGLKEVVKGVAENSTVTALAGSVNLPAMPGGVTFTNKSDGTVKVDNVLVYPDETLPATGNRNTYSIVVSNEVSGELGDENKEFTYVVTLKDSYGDSVTKAKFEHSGAQKTILQTIASALLPSAKEISDGDSFTLKSGETATISGLYYGTMYTVSQTDYSKEGYYTASSGALAGSVGGSDVINIKFINENTNKANLAGLKAAVADAQEVQKQKDMFVSFDDVEKKLQTAADLLAREAELTKADQYDINKAETELSDAIASLKYKPADTTKLDKAISRAVALPENLQSMAIFAKTQKAWDAANNTKTRITSGVLDVRNQTEVDAVADALDAAINELLATPADYTKLNALVATAKERIDSGLYNDESITALQNALKALDYTKTITQQDDVDAMVTNLENIMKVMVYKKADVTTLQDAISRAEGLTKDKSLYKDFSEVEAALKAAKDLLASEPDATKAEEITKAVNTLLTAVNALKYKDVDRTLFDSLVERAKVVDRKYYTEGSLDVLDKALAAATNYVSEHKEMDIRNQEDISALAKTLAAAMEDLVFQPADLTALNAAVTKAERLNPSYFTDFTAVQKALASAKALAAKKDIDIRNQADVNNATKALTDAMNALVLNQNAPGGTGTAGQPGTTGGTTTGGVVGGPGTTTGGTVTVEGKGDATQPKTGDNTPIVVLSVLAFLFGSAGIGAAVMLKKSKRASAGARK